MKKNTQPLSLRVPEPTGRPGDTPDFSHIRMDAAGVMDRPEVSTAPHAMLDHAFGLIRVLGRETAGALSFLPAGQLPQAQEAQRRPVALAELQQRIDDRNMIPFAIWDDKVRMSVAGYQDKLLVLREGSLELFGPRSEVLSRLTRGAVPPPNLVPQAAAPGKA